jgi:hypothetical protein
MAPALAASAVVPWNPVIETANLAAMVDAIDRDVLGYAHPQDHAHLRSTGRTGFVYLNAVGEPLGYGYSSEIGRFGPIAMLDETLTARGLRPMRFRFDFDGARIMANFHRS